MTFIVSSPSFPLTILPSSDTNLQTSLPPPPNQNQITSNNINLLLRKDLIANRHTYRLLLCGPVSTSGNRSSSSRNPPPPPLPTFISPSSTRATNPLSPLSPNWTRCCKPSPLILPHSRRGREQSKGKEEGGEQQKSSDNIS